MFILPSYVSTVLDTLHQHGYEGYIVGGCVRDFLLERTPADFDVTTNATPTQVEEVFKEYQVVETGLQHGTVTVLVQGYPVEITTYRIDGTYSDGRHPDSVEYTSNLKDDLSRRDFTINAMAYNHTDGIIDEFDGMRDLNNRVIRCVGNPQQRFSEDSLRILRAIRFSSQLTFSIDMPTSFMIHNHKKALLGVSKERITVELNKLIMGNNVHHVLMEYSDVISTIIPEIAPCIGFNQHSKYHKYDIWEHIAVSVDNAPLILHVRLAMLLHDIGKPQTFRLDENGQGHFPNHAHVGAKMVEKILKDLKYDNATIKRVTMLVYHHDDEFNSEYDIKKALLLMGMETFMELLKVQSADALSKYDFCKERLHHIDTVKNLCINIVARGDCLSLKELAIGGNDLKGLGIEGKAIGETLDYLLDEVMKGNVINEKTELMQYLKRYN
jgi:tRNA nucleotidyltransferase (CCA-adding enzyme)